MTRGRLIHRTALMFLLFGAVPAVAQQSDIPERLLRAIQNGEIKVVDLSHSVSEKTPYWPEGNAPSPFHARVTGTFDRNGLFARELQIPEHFGTHIDAPGHFDPRGKTVDQIPAANLMAAAIVVDVTPSVRSNVDYELTVADLERWQKDHGAIPRGCIVMLRSGWSERWPSQERFMNRDASGVMHYPGYSMEAAKYLLERVHPVALGIDTPSIDHGPTKNNEVHHVTMTAGLYHLENVAGLENLPAGGAIVIAMPLKLEGGSGSPARVVALVPTKN